MSDASVITDVSETLRSILDAHLNPAAGSPAGVGAPVTVTVDNPQRSAGEDLRVNLYLYHILQDESRRNAGQGIPLVRTPDSVTYVAEPLPLKLYYMVTAFAPEGRTEHRLIGEAIQVLHRHRVLEPTDLRGGLATTPLKADRIHLVLLNQDLETLHRIWGNFQEALRPSATFEVAGIYLDALDQQRTVKTVQQRRFDVVPVPYLTEVIPAAVRPGATVRLHGANLDLRSADGTVNLSRILLDGAPIAPLPDRRTNRALSIVVPPSTKPGPVALQVQIAEYVSSTMLLEVLP